MVNQEKDDGGWNRRHPSRLGSREGTPSIAAVVASVDDSFVQFPASLRIQTSKEEVSYSGVGPTRIKRIMRW